MEESDLAQWFPHPDTLSIAQYEMAQVHHLQRQVDAFEQRIEEEARSWGDGDLALLRTVPGIGKTVAMTILVEVGDINRFADARKFSSFCRVVPGCANSSGVEKRGANAKSKQGNAFLKWAMCMAASKAAQFYPIFDLLRKKHIKRHKGAGGKMIATNTVAHRITLAVYHILKDKEPYCQEKLFNQHDIRNAATIGK